MKVRMFVVLVTVALWLVACISLGGCATAPWPRETVAEETAYQAVAAVDAADTLRIARCPYRWSETNPMLGRHPGSNVVVPYFVAFGAAHVVATNYLVAHDAPAWVVRLWEMSTIAYEGRALAINASLGVRP